MESYNNTFFCGIAGSRTYNLQVERSDIDFCFLSSICPKEKGCLYENKDGYNIITMYDKFFFQLLYSEPYWATWQWFFMKEYKSKNAFTEFIQLNRNNFVYKNLPLFYKSQNKIVQVVKDNFEVYYQAGRKNVAYAFLFLHVFINLAQGKEPVKCFRPEGEMHNFLINIRNGEYPKEYLWNEFLKLEEQKNKELKFYDVSRDEEFFRMVKNEIDKYNFLPYEEWKKEYAIK